MTDKKFTDEEIIKALECHFNEELDKEPFRCVDCPLYNDTSPSCTEALRSYALDLINRQKAKIDRLKECPKCVYEYDGEVMEYCVQSPCSNFKTVEQVKAEACKNFSQKLIKSSRLIANANGFDIKAVVDVEEIVKILKETVGEEP